MNLKPILRYQLRQYRNTFLAIYGLIYALLVVVLILKYFYHSVGAAMGGSGLDGMTTLACFIGGLALFKNAFRFFTSCSVSRRRLFCGFTAAIAVIAVIVSLIDIVNAMIFSRFFDYRTFYLVKTFGDSVAVKGVVAFPAVSLTFALMLKNWLWCFLSDFSIGMLGFLIGALYFRMSKPVKILVSVGVPAFFIMFLPLLDFNVTHGAIGRFLAAVWAQWTNWGMNPGLDLLSRLAVAALFGGGVWLLLRKAELYH